ncbi:MAG: hypothetical protein ACE5WD_13065 [Candidatus Aminicenantia bacterium]
MKKTKLILFILLLTSFLLSNQTEEKLSDYQLRFNLKGYSWGRLLFIIPFRAYLEAKASLLLEAKKNPEGRIFFTYKDINEPGYIMRTIGFSASELHIRIVNHTVKEGVNYGEQCLNTWEKQNPVINKTITPKIKKALPFIFSNNDYPIFVFCRDKKGYIVATSISNKINPKYAWPSDHEIPMKAYGALAETLKLMSRPIELLVKEEFDNLPAEWIERNVNLAPYLNLIAPNLAKVFEIFTHFRQERPFSIKYFIKKLNEQKIIIEGEAEPKVKIWKNYKIHYFYRQLIYDLAQKEVIKERIVMEINDKKGRGGKGYIELIKTEN